MRHILTYGGIFLNGTKKETATVGEKNHMGLNGLSVPASKKVENVCVCGGGGQDGRFPVIWSGSWEKPTEGGGKRREVEENRQEWGWVRPVRDALGECCRTRGLGFGIMLP
jgi:hypothetical protein